MFNALRIFFKEDYHCDIVLVGMAILNQIIWHPKTTPFVGYCNFDNELELENSENLATDAHVLILVSLNGK